MSTEALSYKCSSATERLAMRSRQEMESRIRRVRFVNRSSGHSWIVRIIQVERRCSRETVRATPTKDVFQRLYIARIV